MESNRRTTIFRTLAALGLMFALGNGTTWAADMCLQDDYYSVLVAKNFRFPRAGDCKPVNGYELGTGCVLSGTACGTSNNVDVRFNLSATCPDGYMGTSSFRIDRLYSNINQAGFGNACALNTTSGSWYCTQWHINTIPCPDPRPVN